MCVRGSDYVSFNFRNILTFGENPLSRIISFNFCNCSRRDAVGHEQNDANHAGHCEWLLLGGCIGLWLLQLRSVREVMCV